MTEDQQPELPKVEWPRAKPSTMDYETVKVFADGSSSAQDKMEWNLGILRKKEEILKLLFLFIHRHGNTLAGLWWSTWGMDPEIEMAGDVYRGERVTPAEVAALWPTAMWERTHPKYDHLKETQRDWVAKVDGVLLRIEAAERYEKPKEPRIPKNGPVLPVIPTGKEGR